jgi:hypothetical protein
MDADESKPEELVLIVDRLPDLICDVPIEAYFFVGAITSTVLGVDTISVLLVLILRSYAPTIVIKFFFNLAISPSSL